MNLELKDIPEFQNWNVIEEINEGWSKDKKYYIQDKLENELLLRITNIEMFDTKKREFEIIQKFNTLNYLNI